MSRWRWAGVLVLGLAGAGLVAGLTIQTRRNELVWDHFDVVKPGLLYRSGQLTIGQTEEAVKTLGLKTLVNLQLPGEMVEKERALAERMGIEFINLPMPGDGFGREDQFRTILAALDDSDRVPLLVHCARGTCRTSATVALYRFERDGWTIEDVSAEMERQVYRDGWIAGYIYGMVKDRPTDNLPGIPKDEVATASIKEADADVR